MLYLTHPSITKVDGQIAAVNCTYELILYSRTELRLFLTSTMAQQLMFQQQQHVHYDENVEEEVIETPMEILRTPKFSFDDQGTQAQYPKCITPMKSKLTKNKQKSYKQLTIEKSERKDLFYTFQKRTKTQLNRFTISIPDTNQHMEISFSELGFYDLTALTIRDLKQAVLNQHSPTVKVYQYMAHLNHFMQVRDDTRLSDIKLIKGMAFKFMDLRKYNHEYSYVKNEFGEVELMESKLSSQYQKLVNIKQDDISIDDSIIKLVRQITFYNFGQSIKYAISMRKDNPEKFRKWVEEWAKQNEFNILHLDTHLIVSIL